MTKPITTKPLINRPPNSHSFDKGGKLKTGKLKLSDIPEAVKIFMPEFQQRIIVGSEEHWETIDDLNKIITTMPKTYQTQNTPADEKIVWLHYFYGQTHIYIVEKDKIEKEQLQATGYTILGGDMEMAEWGYISIEEIKSTNRIELDFYFEPIKFGELKKEWEEEPDGSENFETGTGVRFKDHGIEVSGEVVRRNGKKVVSLYKDNNYSGREERIRVPDWNKVKTLYSDEHPSNKHIVEAEQKAGPKNRSLNFSFGQEYNVPQRYAVELLYLLKQKGFNIIKENPQSVILEKDGHQFYFNDNGGEFNLGEDKINQPHIANVPYATVDDWIEDPETLADDIEQVYKDYFGIIPPEHGEKFDNMDAEATGFTEFEPEPEINKDEARKDREDEMKDEYEKKRQSLDEFFTPKFVAERMYKLAVRHGFTGGNCCEPSFGHGVFFDVLIEAGIPQNQLYGFEIFPANVEFVKSKYPDAHLVGHNFEYEFAKNDKALIRDGIHKSGDFQNAEIDLFIGNPPYGYHKSPYSYLWDEDLQVRIEGFFIYLCLQKLKKGGILVFIINSLWLYNGNKYNRQKERIYELGNLIDAYRLPSNTFKGENRDTSIATDIVVFQKK